MKPIRIFRHIDCEGPGYLAEYLDQRSTDYELIAIDAGEPVPATTQDAAGLVFMGGSMSVNDDLPWIAQELALIREAVEREIPVMGLCLGSQLISKALDAKVSAGPCMEIGWHPVQRVASSDPWLNGLPAEFDAFHWHGETFELPANANLLLSSALYPNQAYSLGPHLALQCHVEMTGDLVREWARRYADDLQRSCTPEHDAKALCENLDQRVSSLQSIAKMLFERWLENCRF
jgi:GMP synthase-like glutamine amidotransferase